MERFYGVPRLCNASARPHISEAFASYSSRTNHTGGVRRFMAIPSDSNGFGNLRKGRVMAYLGICYGHNATIAVVKDGQLVFCQSEERFNRIKNSTGFPSQTLEY